MVNPKRNPFTRKATGMSFALNTAAALIMRRTGPGNRRIAAKEIEAEKGRRNHLTHRTSVVAVSLCVVLLATAGCEAPPDTESRTPGLQQKAGSNLLDKWGIEVVNTRLSAAGRIVDFRYRVIDPGKASPIVKRGVKAYLIHSSGATLAVPRTAKVGPLRTTSKEAAANRIYFILFGNPGVVKRGDKVTVAIGDFKAENLTVQ